MNITANGGYEFKSVVGHKRREKWSAVMTYLAILNADYLGLSKF